MKPLQLLGGKNVLTNGSHYTGRFGIEVPVVKGGCDEWELDFAIKRHERFLNRIGELTTMDKRNYYIITLVNLGYLYKRKGDYQRALEIFNTAKDFDEKRKIRLYLREYEMQIQELKELLAKERKN